jgi:hypothetical protein
MIVDHNTPKIYKPRRGLMIKKQMHLRICFVNIYISKVLLITNPSLLKKRIIG